MKGGKDPTCSTTDHVGRSGSHGLLSDFFGGKYDLIQLHRQIMHQYARNYFFTTKLSPPPAISI